MRRQINTTSPFTLKVIAAVKRIPRGKIATYGQIAALAGKPHAARGVAWILHACAESHGLPWQRVLNSKGGISFPKNTEGFREQARLLRAEGIELDRGLKTLFADLAVYQWRPAGRRAAAAKRLTPTIFR